MYKISIYYIFEYCHFIYAFKENYRKYPKYYKLYLFSIHNSQDDINNKKAAINKLKEEIENDKRLNRGIAIDLRNKQRCVSVEVSFLNKLNAAVKKDGSKYTTSVNYKKRYVKTSRNKSIFS